MKQTSMLICFLCWGALGLHAQKTSANRRGSKSNLPLAGSYQFSIAPVPLAYSTLDAGVERQMNARTGLLAQGHIGFRNIQLWESLGGKYFNVGGKLEYRQYLGRHGLQGPYLAAWMKGQDARVRATLQKKDYTLMRSQSLTPGAGVGWKFPLTRKWPNVTFDISIGGGYRFGKVNGRFAEKSRSVLFKDRGLVPAIGFRIGYAPAHPAAGEAYSKSESNSGQSAVIAFHDQYSRRERKTIEKALLRQGFDPGRANGRFDADTIRAIRQFQRKHGLAADGMAGKSTLKLLLKK